MGISLKMSHDHNTVQQHSLVQSVVVLRFLYIYTFINIYYRYWKTWFWLKKRVPSRKRVLYALKLPKMRHSWWSASSYISAGYLLSQHHTTQILIIIGLLDLLDFNIVREERKDLERRFERYSEYLQANTLSRKQSRRHIAIPQAVTFPRRATARRGVTPETGDPSHSYQEADRCPRE